MKQNYYNITNILEKKAQYNMLLGERSNGKSYQVKLVALWEAYNECDYYSFAKFGKMVKKDRYEFAYLRRWREEIKNKDIENYFGDMDIKNITKNEYTGVEVYQGEIYFKKFDSVLGKEIRGKHIGKAFCLTGETHYKSLAFPKIGNVIFEEFITKSGYLPHEVDNLTSIISTIARRDFIRVFLIGNTISRLCPYFDEWELIHVKKQEQGTIDIYRHKTSQFLDNGNQLVVSIAVEYCANSGNNSKMFFGNNTKMVTSGVWESEEFPHLERSLNSYKIHYQLIYEYSSFKFVICLLTDPEKPKEPFLYIYPCTKEKKDIKRRITDKFTTDRYTTMKLTTVLKYDTLIMELINQKKIVYSDNLTGTEFNQIKKEKGGY